MKLLTAINNTSPGILLITLSFFICYSLFCLYILITPVKSENTLKNIDLVAFLTGAKIVSTGENLSIFNVATQLKHQEFITQDPTGNSSFLAFKNPPLVALLFLPFIQLPLITSYFILLMINGLLVSLCAIILNKTLNLSQSYILITFLFFPNISALSLGQTSALAALLMFTSIYFLKTSKTFLSGVLIGLLSIKPQLLLIVPFLLILSKSKLYFLLSFLGTTSIFWLANIWLFGNNIILDFLTFIIQTEQSVYGSQRIDMYTLTAGLENILDKLSIHTQFIALFLNFIGYFLSLCIYQLFTAKSKDFHQNISLAIILSIIFAVHLLNHDLISLLYPLLYFLDQLRTKQTPVNFLSVVLILIVSVLSLFNLANIGALILLILALLIFINVYRSRTRIN